MRTFAALIRREAWEHRSLYIVPLVLASLIVIGTLFADVRVDSELHQQELRTLLRFSPVGLVFVFFLVMSIVSFFYLLDALYVDRRDRSILFWKSMPVSDTRIVLSKLAVVMLLIPAIVLVAALATLFGSLLVGSLRAALGGESALSIWLQLGFLDSLGISVAALMVQSMSYFPLYAYLLLVSAFARRAVFLWATLTPIAIILVEDQLFGSARFARALGHQLAGVLQEHALTGPHLHHPGQSLREIVDPARFLADPALYYGIIVGILLLAVAIWLRRYRDET